MEHTTFLDSLKELQTSLAVRFMEEGEDLDQQNFLGETALIIVAKEATVHCKGSSARSIFYKLVNYGANVNARDMYGKTALMYAIISLSKVLDVKKWASDSFVLEYLIFNGADLQLTDNEGKTALDIAKERSSGVCLKIVLEASLHSNEKEFYIKALQMGHLELAIKFIFTCPDINVLDAEGNTLLMLALKHMRREKNFSAMFKLCEKLLLFGVDVNAQNSQGQTAMMMLVMRDFPLDFTHIIALMTDEGADLDMKDCNGDTALLHVLKSATVSRYSVRYLKWLLRHGACPTIPAENTQALTNFVTKLPVMSPQLQKNWNAITVRHVNHFIATKDNDMVRFLVINGVIDMRCTPLSKLQCILVVEDRLLDNMDSCSPFIFALLNRHTGLAKYLLASGYLTPDDVTHMTGSAIEAFLPSHATALLRDLYSQPWPLVKLAFVAVSASLGSFPERKKRIDALPLPERLKSMLNFQEQNSYMCGHEWDHIPIHSRDYYKSDRGRPLLYYWPFGKSASFFSCRNCRLKKNISKPMMI